MLRAQHPALDLCQTQDLDGEETRTRGLSSHLSSARVGMALSLLLMRTYAADRQASMTPGHVFLSVSSGKIESVPAEPVLPRPSQSRDRISLSADCSFLTTRALPPRSIYDIQHKAVLRYRPGPMFCSPGIFD